MISLSGKINKNYAVELNFLYQVRPFDDGIDFFNIDCRFDRYKADHKPSFLFSITLLNWYLIEFHLYNINHCEENVDVFKCPKCNIEIRIQPDVNHGGEEDA